MQLLVQTDSRETHTGETIACLIWMMMEDGETVLFREVKLTHPATSESTID